MAIVEHNLEHRIVTLVIRNVVLIYSGRSESGYLILILYRTFGQEDHTLAPGHPAQSLNFIASCQWFRNP